MRELNPRAWSIDGECWCTRVDYDGYKKEWSGIVSVLAPDNRSKRIGEIEDTNIIVEFPTGLKDKNGKEICEGDIVKTCSIGTWAVEGRRGCFFVGKYALYGHNDYGEVIGNIHENPELLKEK